MNLSLILPFLISYVIGFFIYKNLILRSELKSQPALTSIFSMGIGLAVSSLLTFLSFILFNKLNKHFVINLHWIVLAATGGILIYRMVKNKISWNIMPRFSVPDILLLIVFLMLLIPAVYWGTFFIDGGWDAWSTWNFKARCLYLGEDHWKNMFDPVLWRSSPHYPLILPLINVWGWCFQTEAVQQIPFLTSLIFMIMTVSLLYAGLKIFISSRWAFVIIPLLLLNTYYMKIAMSQYCDIVLSYYLLAGMISLMVSRKENSQSFGVLAGLNFGILAFTKPEGMVAAGILIAVSFLTLLNLKAGKWREKIFSWLYVFYGFLIGLIPTLLFHILYAPKNQTMINGLISKDHPSTLDRLDVIWKFYVIEMLGDISPLKGLLMGAWHGLWHLILIGLMIALFNKKRLFDAAIRPIPLFIAGYMGVITFYYFVNTYFPIAWWMQVSLHRIYFSLLPVILFWVVYAVWKEN